MKKNLVNIALAIAAFVMLFAAVTAIYYNAVFKYVPLGNDIKWEYSWRYWEGQKALSALSKNGRIMVGPHSFMELWGAYPYIAGKFLAMDFEEGLVNRYFVYDIATDQVAFYNDWQEIKEPLRFTLQDVVSFWDVSGPWKKTEKLKALRTALEPPETSETPEEK